MVRTGNIPGHEPQYRVGDGEWLPIPISNVPFGAGIPFPCRDGEILRMIGLYGYHQAHALSHQYMAQLMSVPPVDAVTVRVKSFDVSYSIKAKPQEDEDV